MFIKSKRREESIWEGRKDICRIPTNDSLKGLKKKGIK